MRFGRFGALGAPLIFLAVLLVLALAAPGVGRAQEGDASSGSLSELYAQSDEPSLSDYQSLASSDAELVASTRTELEGFFGQVAQRVAAAPQAFGQMIRVLERKSPSGEAGYFAGLFAETALFLALAFLIEYGVYGSLLVKPWFVKQRQSNPQGLVEKLPLLLLRAGLGAIGVLVSVVTAVTLGAIFGGPLRDDATKETLIVAFAVYVIARLISLCWRLILAPFLPEYRLTSLDDPQAEKLYHWLWITASLALIFQGVCVWMAALGLPKEAHTVLTVALTFLIVLLNVAMVAANRRAITRAIRNGKSWAEATWPARWAGALWGPLVVLYAVVSWLVMSVNLLEGRPAGPPLIITAYVVLLTALVVYGVFTFLIQRFFMRRRAKAMLVAAERAEVEPDSAAMDADEAAIRMADGPGDSDDDEEGAPKILPREPEPLARWSSGGMRTYEDLAGRVASILAVAAGLYTLYSIWTDKALMTTLPKIDKAIDIAVIVLIGYVGYHALRIWIDQKIEEEGGFDAPGLPGEGEGGGVGASRLATLLPLFRNFLLAMITITVALIIALEMGVNVAPLFAGAGIVGLAIGFGSQALVRDILSGAFFLFDDAFRKGEYIDLGSVKGTVERISVRSFQLRHHLGYLHTVPFGEIQHITNFSRDWVIMKLPLRLTYDTDAEAVRKKIKKLGEQLLEHPEHGAKFLQPLKSQGVIQMEDSAMIMRVKFMTKPGDQWELRKVVYALIRDLFEREGIRFAHREVTVRLADQPSAPLSPAQREAVAGAALPAIEAERAEELAESPADMR